MGLLHFKPGPSPRGSPGKRFSPHHIRVAGATITPGARDVPGRRASTNTRKNMEMFLKRHELIAYAWNGLNCAGQPTFLPGARGQSRASVTFVDSNPEQKSLLSVTAIS